ncbi:hypothetical protein GF318_02510 [Candidatus Micrarchaeota archaeon]|nr:hypothetical protein [Candidatus Micrarchaeota archaeon]
MKFLVLFGMALILASLASAMVGDVGPPPDNPDITVALVEDNEPYDGYIELVFHCIEPVPDGQEGSPLAEREVNFSCSGGVCTNAQWFYKFNPCFQDSSGYFKYRVKENQNYRSSNTLSYGQGDVDAQLDVGDGSISYGEIASPCPVAFLLLLLLGFLKWK